MRPLLAIREAGLTAWSAKVPALLVFFLAAAMCAATLLTVGRSAQAEAEVLTRLDTAGARELTVSAKAADELLPALLVEQVAGLSVVDRAVGLTTPVDAYSTAVGPGGPAVQAWQVIGELGHVAVLVSGRWPLPGEALASTGAAETLGLVDGVGSVTTATAGLVTDHSVVGTFSPREPYDAMGTGVLVATTEAPSTPATAPMAATATTLSVILTDADEAARTQSLVIAMISPPDLGKLTLTSPVGLAELRGQVAGDLGSFGRSLLLGVLGGGALLTAVVVLADVLVRRPDLGRRRALGATRSSILALVVLRTAIPAVAGAVVGSVAGVLLAARLGAAPPPSFVIGTAVLAVLAATLSTLLPAGYAATRDPVRVLRTP
ncbi:ABC transporter permease [Salana multivorans]